MHENPTLLTTPNRPQDTLHRHARRIGTALLAVAVLGPHVASAAASPDRLPTEPGLTQPATLTPEGFDIASVPENVTSTRPGYITTYSAVKKPEHHESHHKHHETKHEVKHHVTPKHKKKHYKQTHPAWKPVTIPLSPLPNPAPVSPGSAQPEPVPVQPDTAPTQTQPTPPVTTPQPESAPGLQNLH